MKQSVSYGETKCFKRLKLFETPIHLINLTIATISLNLFFQEVLNHFSVKNT